MDEALQAKEDPPEARTSLDQVQDANKARFLLNGRSKS
jgi:hypothetical protein